MSKQFKTFFVFNYTKISVGKMHPGLPNKYMCTTLIRILNTLTDPISRKTSGCVLTVACMFGRQAHVYLLSSVCLAQVYVYLLSSVCLAQVYVYLLSPVCLAQVYVYLLSSVCFAQVYVYLLSSVCLADKCMCTYCHLYV